MKQANNVETSIRLKPAMHAALRAAAEEHGISLHAEILQRLTNTLRNEAAVVPEVLDAAFDPVLAGLVMAMGCAMSRTAAGPLAGLNGPDKAEWHADPWTFLQVKAAAATVLDAFEPDGPAIPPEILKQLPAPIAEVVAEFGRGVATGALRAIALSETAASVMLDHARRRLTDLLNQRQPPPEASKNPASRSRRKGSQSC